MTDYTSNIINVAFNYLQQLKIPITETTLKESLRENPYYPSLYSISNVLDRFHIEHTAIKISKENFEKLHPPFIANLKNIPTGKDFVLVTSVTENEVQYISENKKAKKAIKEDFLKNWQNIVLLAEPNEKSKEKDFLLNRKKELSNTNRTKAFASASLLWWQNIMAGIIMQIRLRNKAGYSKAGVSFTSHQRNYRKNRLFGKRSKTYIRTIKRSPTSCIKHWNQIIW